MVAFYYANMHYYANFMNDCCVPYLSSNPLSLQNEAT